ncbi:MAG: hypothetical protein Q9222_006617 [Ikaeria aurantiellina]
MMLGLPFYHDSRVCNLHSTRGQGRSPYTNFTTFHYDDIARDAVAVLDHLQVANVAVVGWSDGAITGLNLAMNYTSRIERVFAHGANVQANQSIPGLDDPIINSGSGSLDADFSTNGTTYSARGRLAKRATNRSDAYSCESLSPLPDRCDAMIQAVQTSVFSLLILVDIEADTTPLPECGHQSQHGVMKLWHESNARFGAWMGIMTSLSRGIKLTQSLPGFHLQDNSSFPK